MEGRNFIPTVYSRGWKKYTGTVTGNGIPVIPPYYRGSIVNILPYYCSSAVGILYYWRVAVISLYYCSSGYHTTAEKSIPQYFWYLKIPRGTFIYWL
jgi:hypothetical protein